MLDRFCGFSKETGEFLWDLAFHNEKPWFLDHKERFLRCLKEPFDTLAHETLLKMEELFPDKEFSLHISRIYRDARRLFGRGPYKDHLWFTIWTGKSRNDNPAFWFEIGPSSYSYGVGFFTASAEQMSAYRARIDAEPASVERLAKRFERQNRFVLRGENYKRMKADRGELLNPWYNKKCIWIECSHDLGGDAFSSDLPAILADGFRFLMPYYALWDAFRD